MPHVATSVPDLLTRLQGQVRVEGERLVVEDADRLRASGIADVVWSATFSTDADVVEAARWIVWEASQALGARSASIHELYMARGRVEVGGFTVPAVNVRTQVFDMALTICRAAQSMDVGTVIFEPPPRGQQKNHPPPPRAHHPLP